MVDQNNIVAFVEQVNRYLSWSVDVGNLSIVEEQATLHFQFEEVLIGERAICIGMVEILPREAVAVSLKDLHGLHFQIFDQQGNRVFQTRVKNSRGVILFAGLLRGSTYRGQLSFLQT